MKQRMVSEKEKRKETRRDRDECKSRWGVDISRVLEYFGWQKWEQMSLNSRPSQFLIRYQTG